MTFLRYASRMLALTVALALVSDPASTAEPRKLKVVFSRKLITTVHENDGLAAIKVWVDHLTKELGEDLILGAEIHYVSDRADLGMQLQTLDVDVAVLHPMEYVEVESLIDMVPRFTAIRDGETAYGVSLLVREDSSIHSLPDLRGRTLIGERPSIAVLSDLWIERLLGENGLGDPADFFRNRTSADRVSQAALAVFFGQVDACIVKLDSYRTLVEMNPQVGNALRTISESMSFCRTVVCIEDPDSPEGKLIVEALSSLHETSKGKQLLAMFAVDQLVRFRPEYLDGVRRLLSGTRENTK